MGKIFTRQSNNDLGELMSDKKKHTEEETIEDKYKNICRFLTFILRHKPQIVNIKLDENGFTDLNKILYIIEKRFKLKLNEQEFNSVIKKYAFNFFKIENKKIKAKFGHTVILNMNIPDGFEITKQVPNRLYGCINKNEMWTISKNGLQNNSVVEGLIENKQKLRITSNYVYASINSEKAIKNNVEFYYNKLSDSYFCKFVPSQFLNFELI